ncbi:hypothetical protein [Caulobacter sp. 1776]|uniref:hypothetical protein n=1 Tax=Caulobacter sp. 1776 TaxID=3156420 RepID=UPI00339AFEA7
MRSAFIVAACVVSALGLGGCMSGFTGAPATTIDVAKVSSCPVFAKNDAPNSNDYDNKGSSDEQRRVARNAFVDKCAAAIETSYQAFAQNLSSDQKLFVVGSDLATSGVTAAATLAKSARTKTYLTTYAGLLLGFRGSVEKELFFNQTLPALKAQMEASRDEVMTRIIQNKARSVADYTLDAAVTDLKAYYAAGTLTGAVTRVTTDAGAKAVDAKMELKRVTEAEYSYTEAAKKLRRYWRPDGAVNDANAAKLKKWLDENADGRSISELLYGGVSPALQAQAVKDLNIQ